MLKVRILCLTSYLYCYMYTFTYICITTYCIGEVSSSGDVLVVYVISMNLFSLFQVMRMQWSTGLRKMFINS